MKRPKAAGFSLVEVAMALGIAAFCLVATVGLLPVGLNNSQNASFQTGAVSLMSAVAADLRGSATASPTPLASSPYFGVPIATGTTLYVDEGSGFSGAIATGTSLPSRYRVTVTNVFASGSGNRMATREKVLITWPAQATPANATGFMDGVVAIDRN